MLSFDALAKLPLASLPQLGVVDTTGLAAGTATVTGAIEAVKDFAGSADGVATVSGAIEAVKDFAGSAAGTATVQGFTDTEGAGLAAGTATVTGVGASTADTAGIAAGAAAVAGVGVGTFDFFGTAAGTSTAAAQGEAATTLGREIVSPGFDLAQGDTVFDPLTGLPVILTDDGSPLDHDDAAIETAALPQAAAITVTNPISRSTPLFQ